MESCTTPGDEDCDGLVDEEGADCVCVPGEQSACYTGPAGTENVGPCKGGMQVCNADGKSWGECVGQVLPVAEDCTTGEDEDCSGEANAEVDGCVCPPAGQTQCYTGPDGTKGVGICVGGVKTCADDGKSWGVCEGEVLPSAESCEVDGDEDCDGVSNEAEAGCVCLPGTTKACYEGPVGTEGVGTCAVGSSTCNADGKGWGACVGQVLPAEESCDSPGDEDCDGKTNEEGAGCVCLPGAVESCYEGPDGTLGVGICVAGTKTCNADGKTYGPCEGQVVPAAESCLVYGDEDCDGQVNEEGTGCACPPGAVEKCYSGPAGTAGVGVCKAGSRTCNFEGSSWGPCEGEVLPSQEYCFTPDDDDCNGSNLVCSGATDVCGPNGTCVTPCDPLLLGTSYIGCEYYPTVTTNSQLGSKAAPGASGFHFAVAIANTDSKSATYTITRGTAYTTSGTVAANSVQIVQLPWVTELANPSSYVSLVSRNSTGAGAYRLVASRPVTVYQYNPLEYSSGGGYSYTNDASLLLPVNAWRSTYRVAARNTWSGYPGFYAVVASQDATSVTLSPSATGAIIRAGGGVASNGTGTVSLNRGDVLQVMSASGGGGPDISDVTGTYVSSTKPVQVFGGHDCTDIPWNVTWCDHIEESMFPIETLSTEYFVGAPWIGVNSVKANQVRIVAMDGATTLTYDPPQSGAPTSIAAAGRYVEFQTSGVFRITGSGRILVAQYMIGQAAGGNTGDPAMALAVTSQQYRTNYLFHAPTNYEANFVNVMAPTGASVTLDGAAVTGFTAIGSTGFGIARVQLPNTNLGNHRILSNMPAGISVYGYGQYTSYWYPGGLDLKILQ
ncbi:MAG TPA: IgGFc-binding protein [Polyangiaceae bacterium]|nr:IgGFc-binding protein [Polyangiaceae bacterium]